MSKLTKKAIRDGRTDPNYRKASLLIMHLSPAGHRPSPLGLASDQSYANSSSEFELPTDLKK